MPAQLRKKPPFWCRHKDASGKLDHLDAVLAESDTDLCPDHEAERKAAHERLFKPPQHQVRTSALEEPYTGGPIWPQPESQPDHQEVA